MESVYKSFCKIIDEQLETRTFKRSKGSHDCNKAWWNEELGALAKRVRYTLKAWERDKTSTDLKLSYLSSQKIFGKLVRKSKRQFRRERQMKLLDQQNTRPKEFSKFVKGIGSESHALPRAMQKADGIVVSTPGEVLNAWKDYFCDLLNPKASHKLQTTAHPIDCLHLDASESLQSFVAKTYCRILNSRLKEWLEHNSALSDEQNGFRTDRCCQDHTFALTSIIENRMAQKEDTFTCFIDFKKAFDCVSRDLLWERLEKRFGLSSNFLLAVKALYEDVVCSVNVNNTLTDWFSVNSGVKQGCILSPTLFAMYIDDLVQEINHKHLGVDCQMCTLSALLYADGIDLTAPSDRLPNKFTAQFRHHSHFSFYDKSKLLQFSILPPMRTFLSFTGGSHSYILHHYSIFFPSFFVR